MGAPSAVAASPGVDVTCGRALAWCEGGVLRFSVFSRAMFSSLSMRCRLRHQRRRMNSTSSNFMYASLPGIQDRTILSPYSSKGLNQPFFLSIKSAAHRPSMFLELPSSGAQAKTLGWKRSRAAKRNHELAIEKTGLQMV